MMPISETQTVNYFGHASNTEPTPIVRIYPHNGRITSPALFDDLRLYIRAVYNIIRRTHLQHWTVVRSELHIITKPKNRLRIFVVYYFVNTLKSHTDNKSGGSEVVYNIIGIAHFFYIYVHIFPLKTNRLIESKINF